MAISYFEVGFVSASTDQVRFLKEVFDLEIADEIPVGPGVLYRFKAPGAAIKVMVPNQAPKPLERADPFYSATGLRYLTLHVDDMEAVLERVPTRGGRVRRGPRELSPGVQFAIIEDADGNPLEVVHNANS
jgi:predicted enzyme related to lactoylglutathione lyase